MNAATLYLGAYFAARETNLTRFVSPVLQYEASTAFNPALYLGLSSLLTGYTMAHALKTTTSTSYHPFATVLSYRTPGWRQVTYYLFPFRPNQAA